MNVADDIWADDLLSRKSLGRDLAKVIASMRSGQVFGIDAEFGAGKTFFLQRLERELNSIGLTTVRFDAWRADLIPNPLFSFVMEVAEALARFGIEPKNERDLKDRLVRASVALARIAAKATLRIGSDEIDQLTDPIADEIDKLEFGKKGAAADSRRVRDDVAVARDGFEALITEFQQARDVTVPLVILVDELDRARPDFAIDLIEALKFIFDVKGVVFCIALDRRNFVAAVRGRFGAEYDAERYLSRVFPFWVPIRNVLRNSSFLQARLRDVDLVADGFLQEGDDFHTGLSTAADFAVLGLGSMSGNPRALEQCANRMSLAIRSLPRGHWGGLVGYLSGISMSDREFYTRYISNSQRGRSFHDELKERLSGAEPWCMLMIATCAIPPKDGVDNVFALSFGEEARSEAQKVIQDFTWKRNIRTGPAASEIAAVVGWALG